MSNYKASIFDMPPIYFDNVIATYSDAVLRKTVLSLVIFSSFFFTQCSDTYLKDLDVAHMNGR